MADSPIEANLSRFKSRFGIILLSLSLAIAVWGFTAIYRENRIELILPVETVGTPAGCVASIKGRPSVSFTIAGPAIWLRDARKSNSSLKLRLDGAVVPGTAVFTGLEKNLSLHEKVRVTRTVPASVEIELSGKP